jgi:hypothetical protein
LPASLDVIQGLFGWVNARLEEEDCDHSLRYTLEYARANAVDESSLAAWVQRHSAYCDCEVLYNVEDSNPALDR